jgi:tetratricopeptide (TPR) repeat protein
MTARRLDPRNPKIYLALGQILADKQNFAAAVEYLRRAETLDPTNAEYAYTLGLVLRLDGKFDDAAAQFHEAIRLSLGHMLAHRSRELVRRETGDLEAAARRLRLSAAGRPEDAQGHHLWGTVLLRLKDTQAAVEEFRKAIALDPTLMECRASLVQTLQTRQKRRSEK